MATDNLLLLTKTMAGDPTNDAGKGPRPCPAMRRWRPPHIRWQHFPLPLYDAADHALQEVGGFGG
jgi:hypothetical protein